MEREICTVKAFQEAYGRRPRRLPTRSKPRTHQYGLGEAAYYGTRCRESEVDGKHTHATTETTEDGVAGQAKQGTIAYQKR